MDDYRRFERVLDVGGWFLPNNSATHVVDLMPYETRRAALHFGPEPGERFTKSTWTQIDFLCPHLRLPFEDRYFDFVICGQTVEDLANPEPLLCEMGRIGKQGLIECPSRFHEQTVGVRDRMSNKCGHPHHHWIVDSNDPGLVLYSKTDSRLDRRESQVPLTVYEAACGLLPDTPTVRYRWKDSILYSIVTGPKCSESARAFVARLDIKASARLKDAGLRLARRIRSYTRPRQGDWWNSIVEQSRKFSTIPLP